MTAPDAEERSLDLVQRVVVSTLIIVILGLPTVALVYYSTQIATDSDALGLWVMTGLLGLGSAAAVLVTNRRRPWSPWVLLGLLPMAVAGILLFG